MKRKISINRASQAGVSLIELMVGLTIGLIITAGALTILFSNQKLILEKDVMDRSQENFRFASMTITRLVRQANELGIPANNNELIVTFDRTQRDCLGQSNNSWINTFKVNANNELLCILNNDENLSYVLAKDISEIKFSYGIQNGTSANSLVYQQRFSGNSNTENTAVVNAWNTVTSVLTQMTVSEGNGKQPTIDFIATSHLLALTKLASSGGTSHANSANDTSGNSSSGSGGQTSGGSSSSGGESGGNNTGEGNNQNETPSTMDCSSTDLNYIKVNNVVWPDQTSYTISGIGKGGTVTVVVSGTISSSWRISRDDSTPQSLSSSQSYQLPNGNNKSMTLTLSCGTVPTRSITAKT
ncbi:PilW family protein [Acinetobacter sp. ANC 4173]|uniref:PilW family protein n=1 Tax=Acinetobacter sp. ANC 4173 TaxID=2529837 RepID=UPI00103CFF35|nr:prepilin-type N-terminal cleavage/methylation domain-containing protein [Acinetobacter sp. ANC 4173]TCB79886.1 prepilin-type N-terminal cleavage/methylation domain-containing protein [Acinetobacter sp. ANC 4173]